MRPALVLSQEFTILELHLEDSGHASTLVTLGMEEEEANSSAILPDLSLASSDTLLNLDLGDNVINISFDDLCSYFNDPEQNAILLSAESTNNDLQFDFIQLHCLEVFSPNLS